MRITAEKLRRLASCQPTGHGQDRSVPVDSNIDLQHPF
jgi:hypothetical protein